MEKRSGGHTPQLISREAHGLIMRRSGILTYILVAALLIIALVAIIRMALPKPVDEHAGQVYLNDGFDMIWITPWENVPVSNLTEKDFRNDTGRPVYTGSDYRVETGIDVSEHQWGVDWSLASSEIDFAYVRLGYRGYTEGGLFLDPWYEQNIAGAAAAGLDTGVYFFSQATNVSEAIEEAEFVIEHLQGFRVNLPVIFDWEKIEEGGARTDNLNEQSLTDCAVAFCRTIERAGYDAGVYFNRRLGYHGFDLSRLADYTLWISAPGDFPDYYYACEFWQYSFNGAVSGVTGDADMNLRFIPVE